MRPDPFDLRTRLSVLVVDGDSGRLPDCFVGLVLRVAWPMAQKYVTDLMKQETKSIGLWKCKEGSGNTDDAATMEGVSILPLALLVLPVGVLAVFDFDSRLHISR